VQKAINDDSKLGNAVASLLAIELTRYKINRGQARSRRVLQAKKSPD